jgi:UDP-glucose 4-epimerase
LKNKKILVLGASGFLGRHLVKSLIDNNKVVQFDTEPPSSTHPNSTFIQGSILNIELVQKAMENVDIVYHFAAVTDLDIVNNNPAQAIEVNIAGTTNVLDACIQENVERFFFSSSVYVYSEFGGVYKSTKQACELLIDDYDKMHGLNYTILQLGSVYGPGAKQTNLISRFIDEALSLKKISHKGTGEEVRQYIYVKDVVKAAIDSFDDKYKNKKIILLGNEKITIADLMTEIKSQVNKNIEFAFKNNAYGIHYKSTPFSTEPNSAIQFQTKKPVSLEQGLKETIASIQTGLVD